MNDNEAIGVGEVFVSHGNNGEMCKLQDLLDTRLMCDVGLLEQDKKNLSCRMAFSIKETKKIKRQLKRLFDPHRKAREVLKSYTFLHPLKNRDIIRKLRSQL